MMLTPLSFALHVTYTCPLACAHCCFHSSPQNKDRLPAELILGSIRELPDTIDLVAFTGGEPFLLGKLLFEAIRLASDRGFNTRVVTSAYFGKSESIARNRMSSAKEAGLKELSISWDDYHEEFVSFSAVKNVFVAAREQGISVAINIVQDQGSRWSAARVRHELLLRDDDFSVVCESPLNKTGRASEALADAQPRAERTIGPCPYVLTGPTLSAKGDLLACCGVIPNQERLTLGKNVSFSEINELIAKSFSSTLLNMLYLRGPYALMEYISNRFAVSIPSKNTLGGNCEACSILFTEPSISERIDETIALAADEISGELSVLFSLGWLDAKHVLALRT